MTFVSSPAYKAWAAYVEHGKHLPDWPAILRDKHGRRIRIPKAWQQQYAATHQPVKLTALQHVPSRLKGPGVYVAEGSLDDLFRHAEQGHLGWFAAIPYYWSDDQVRRMQGIQAANNGLPVCALWWSWWGYKGWDSPGADGNGQRQEGVFQQLLRFQSGVAIFEGEMPAGRENADRTAYDAANIPSWLQFAEHLDAVKCERWIVSDHLEAVASRYCGGRLPAGWGLQPECYADWVEYAAPGNVVHFTAHEQLALLTPLVDPRHPVPFAPVEGYFAPPNARAWASLQYRADRHDLTPLAWSGWRGDGSMVDDDWRCLVGS